jgi:hypothetical protein
MFNDIAKIKGEATKIADGTGPPGHVSGPNDALRHIIGSAELTRNYGPLPAWAMLEFNELKASNSAPLGTKPQPAEDAAMDRHNNEIGIKIGRDAKSIEEIIERAKEAVQEGIANQGSGKDGGPVWLAPSEWKDPNGKHDPRPIPEDWKDDGADAGKAAPLSHRTDAILRKPGDTWTEEEARHVMSDPRYWNSRRRDLRIAARVEESYKMRYGASHGGPIQVAAFTRADGTAVAAHSRATPRA